MEVFCCALNAVDDAACAAQLTAAECERLPRFRVDAARRGFIASRALLRSVLAAKTGIAPARLEFVRDADDKPQLADGSWHFNLSHCREWAVLAVSTAGPVGVDVEQCDRSNDIDGIARRFFQRDEADWLQSLPPSQRAEKFCELWTLKEAAVKWCGLGISRALAGIGVQVEAGRIALTLREDIACRGLPSAWLFAPTPKVRLAVIGSADESVQLHRWMPGRDVESLGLVSLAQGGHGDPPLRGLADSPHAPVVPVPEADADRPGT
jgi:phosphopantetheine--protein transferase-like protein